MPVRNFYLEANVDGRKTKLKGGPAKAKGGFNLTINIRKNGRDKEAVLVQGITKSNGELELIVLPIQRKDGVEAVPYKIGKKHGFKVKSAR